MDDKVRAVLDGYHDRMREERSAPSAELDRRLLAVGPMAAPDGR